MLYSPKILRFGCPFAVILERSEESRRGITTLEDEEGE